jgi:hypothetical protein
LVLFLNAKFWNLNTGLEDAKQLADFLSDVFQ